MARNQITWDEFGQSIKESFREVLETQDFSDVTLACEDGLEIEAHRIVLSSGSSFFRNILTKTKHPHPYLYLKGVKKNELESIIDFLYTGESTVASETLNSFLVIAKHLKVKGLEIDTVIDDIKNEHSEISSHNIHDRIDHEKEFLAVDKATKLPSQEENIGVTSDELDAKIEETEMNIESGTDCRHRGEVFSNDKGMKDHMEKPTSQTLTKKMKKVRVTKFLPSWLDMSIRGQSVSTWLIPDPENIHQAMCTLCPGNIMFSITKGWKDVKQHYKTVKHQENKIFAKLHTSKI